MHAGLIRRIGMGIFGLLFLYTGGVDAAASKRADEAMSAQDFLEVQGRMQERRVAKDRIDATKVSPEAVREATRKRAVEQRERNATIRMTMAKPPAGFAHYTEAEAKDKEKGTPPGRVGVWLGVLGIGLLLGAWWKQRTATA